VHGPGYRFEAPASWAPGRKGSTVSASRGVGLVSVTHFTLEKPYRVARFPSVTRELDSVAAGLAKQSSGRIVARTTTRIAGRRTRYYRIEIGDKIEETAFVLTGLDEYQLLCRRSSATSDATCAQLFSTFALT